MLFLVVVFYLIHVVYLFFFFFSSRRRHTRYWRDWSSDVCSSDLEVPEVQRPQVDLRDRPSDGARDGVSATWPQDVEHVRELSPADEIDHHVDGGPAEGADQVCAAIDGLVSTLCHHIGGLRGGAHGDDRRAPALRELYGSEPDSPGGARHEHPLRRHSRPVHHVLRRGVGARQSCELFVAPVTANGVRPARGSDRELGEPTVTLAAEGPALERPVVDRRAEHAANEDPFPDAVTGDALPHVHDATTDVRTLDARELQSCA